MAGRHMGRWNELLAMLTILVSATGCANYHPRPITDESVEAALAPPGEAEIQMQADAWENPLLPSVIFDDRDGLSPDETALLAVLANPALRAARDQRGVASAQVIQAGLLPNPTLAYDFATPVGGSRDGRVNAMGLGLDWKLSDLPGRDARLEAAREQAGSVDLNIAWQEWQAAESAKHRAFRVALAKERLALAGDAESAFAAYRKTIADGVDSGLLPRQDLLEADTAYRNTHSVFLAAQAQVEREQLALHRALGIPPGSVVRLEDNIDPVISATPPIETLAAQSETNRLDLRALRRGYNSSEATVRAAVRAQFPKITLGLTSARDTDALRTLGAGIAIDFPMFDRNQGRIAEARASRKQLFDEYVARVFEMRADLAQIVSAIQAVRREQDVGEETLSDLRETAAAYRRAWDKGRTDSPSYYRVLGQLNEAENAQLDLKEALVDLGIALEVATGRYGLVTTTRSETGKASQ